MNVEGGEGAPAGCPADPGRYSEWKRGSCASVERRTGTAEEPLDFFLGGDIIDAGNEWRREFEEEAS